MTLVAVLVITNNSVENSNHILASAPDSSELSGSQKERGGEASSNYQAPFEPMASSNQDDFEAGLINKLIASYADTINQLAVQASLVKVKDVVLARYPEDGVARFERIIRAAFPEYADSILSILERLAVYNEWLVDSQLALADLSPLERNGTIWDKRRELFGEDAELIWAEERAELAQKKNAMQALIAELDQESHMSIDEKFYQLQNAISEQHEGSVQQYATNPGVIVQAFLNLNSVQKSLNNLPADERQEKLNDLRRQSGFTEERIEELATKDQERDARWNNGLAYMAERETLINTLSGHEHEEALVALREKYFKHEAITIQREEEMDFWRYKRPRIYGVN